uniref:Autophagy protein 5 n=1 Tax=Heterorhabditis bacteriophora TaxID=37862 RepID=A0A1I7WVQ5_HETBA
MSVTALAIRQKKAVQEREVLKCPKCYCRMEPLMLDTDERGFQNIWWMCRNSREKKCDFPLDMPADIYWVKRSPLQVKDGFIPHPEIKLLPQKYRYLYPSIFPNESRTPDSRCTSVLSRDSTETNSSGGSLHTRDMSLGSILPSPIPLSESSNMERHEVSPSIMASSLSTPHYSNTDSGSMSSGGAGPTTALDDLDVDLDDLTSVPYCTRKRPLSSGEEGNSMSESIWNQICSMNVDPRILESSSWYSEGSSQMGLDVPSLHYDPTTFECLEGEQSSASCSALPYSNAISNAASTADTLPVDTVHQNMSPEYDYEISRKVWDAHVPVEFILDTDSPDLPRPSYAMIPRCSYFCLSLPKVITSMKIEDHKQLWNGVMHNRFDEFWSVNKRLMETSDSSPFLNIPIRLYTLSQNFRQIPQPPTNENGQLRTVEDALSILAPDLLLHGRYRFISHGISIPNETPLVYLARNFSYPDNFVHICAVLK